VDYRIPLSKPDVGSDERALLLDAFDFGSVDNWGAHVEGFEADMAIYLGGDVHPVALSSGSAALHLALLLAEVDPGDEVLCPTLTHLATATAIANIGARPVFVDAEPDTWNVDPEQLSSELRDRAKAGRRPAAVVTVDLYGQCAKHRDIVEVAREFEVPVIEDAAEALGATYGGQPAGTLADLGVFSCRGGHAPDPP
jgi:dTDP-4-amino-4,6-dideoxygalactose transaminase